MDRVRKRGSLRSASSRQGRQGCRQGAKRGRRIERCGAREIRPSPSTEASHGIDPDYRCIGAAVWRRRRILGSQYEVIGEQRRPNAQEGAAGTPRPPRASVTLTRLTLPQRRRPVCEAAYRTIPCGGMPGYARHFLCGRDRRYDATRKEVSLCFLNFGKFRPRRKPSSAGARTAWARRRGASIDRASPATASPGVRTFVRPVRERCADCKRSRRRQGHVWPGCRHAGGVDGHPSDGRRSVRPIRDLA